MFVKLDHEQHMSSRDLILLTWVVKAWEGTAALQRSNCEHEYMYEGLVLQDQWQQDDINTQLERLRMV